MGSGQQSGGAGQGAKTASRPLRKILHVDMDAFYAAIEQRDDPALRGRPIAVGGGGERGVVLTASYEARPFGVRSAMPGSRARRLCADLLFVPPRFDAYRAASAQIRAVFRRYTGLVEPLSLDEAYLDVTEPLPGPMPAVEVARRIKQEIREATGLTASAGVSFNKFLAKIASDLEKPDGLTVIRPQQALAFIAGLPIERFHGIGPATAARLRARGIGSGADLQAMSREELHARFGRSGLHYWKIANALDDRPVEPDRPRKSLSVEETFPRDVTDPAILREALCAMAGELAQRLERRGFAGRTLTLKIKYADFRVRTRRLTVGERLAGAARIQALAEQLLDSPAPLEGPVRLLGIGVGNPPEAAEARQLRLDLDLQG
ncbi:DNA polymerase IV [Marinimicrococcus flavescens]|uniref:DNA polymerase IV n=1 Tax=Marinimicrococcus flavescens TaxID=3031815 RepID=A0AAP3XPH4_9PROT|nr:DNA polymerase IV [Marinimicrococcus flavescens]